MSAPAPLPRLRSVLALCLLAVTTCGEGTPTPPVVTTDPRTITPRDGWSSLFTFRDPAARSPRFPAPEGGWFLMPLHGHLLPTGKVMLHGYHRDSRGDSSTKPHTMQNDAGWLIDPADPRLAGAGDVDLPVQVFYPPSAASPGDPNGLHRRDDQSDWEFSEALLCGGHTYLTDGTLFYSGGTAFIPDNDPTAPPHPNSHGDLIAVGTARGARFNPWSTPVGTTRAGWSLTPDGQLGWRYYPTNTRLPDGRVVVTSGYFDTEQYPNPSVEVFDPARNTWAPLVPTIRPGEELAAEDPRQHLFPSAQDYVHAFLLPQPWPAGQPAGNALARQVALLGVTGRVLMLSVDGGPGLDRVFVPPGGRRPASSTDPFDWRAEGSTSVLLPDGRLLTLGGSDSSGLGGRADIYDPRPSSAAFDTWESFPLCDAAGACASRYQSAALYLPDGRVAFLGGRRQESDWASGHSGEMERVVDARASRDERSPGFIDWRTRRVSFGSPWPDDLVRTQHSITLLLPDGRVLVAGGRRVYCEPSCSDEQPTLRLYRPAYLDPALAPWRPRLGALTNDATGGAFGLHHDLPVVPLGARVRVSITTAAAPAPASAMRFALVGLGSITHRFDQNLRYVEVSHAPAGNGYRLTVPAEGAVLPPGPYMLFAVETVVTGSGPIDVPSVATMLMIR